ncbi:L-tyrosine/L-tryptophan isonitrile synthase family protein [Consotaella salsifontis]|uniref:Pyoverdine/dityrosine biosynthesis protein Dit1 n=1 Tax=Consotaella salsifontis TaxID=1365950 RepID=A0A1T4S6N1_9HYPH|nr:L-tyrosine/L-tryptophan isonitrile synthase family protein [Consotaella salsifontis]SKA23736.1 Pyoverdine/dityrosine biosynthesis protein Dit1 [Consotaella salsifontis]
MSNRTSAYVFPFRPFRHLDRARPTARFRDGGPIIIADLAPQLERLAPKLGKDAASSSWEDGLIDLCCDPRNVFGLPEWIRDLKDHWTAMARPFVAAGKPIEFTILGFPFKAPVPLKTRRKLPDFGELVMLRRLHEFARAVERFHAPGARVHIFAEGAFARVNGMPQKDSDDYFDALVALSEAAGCGKTLVLHETSRIADETPSFLDVWKETTEEIRARAEAGDEKTVTALREARPVTFHLCATPGVSEEELRLAYLGDPAAAALRADLERRSDEGVIQYRAFLEARDKVQLLEKFAPGALGLTVSPRPGRIGVRPLPEPADVLPYHGMPVWNEDEQSLRIEYRWDLLTSNRDWTGLKLEGDSDPEPFLLLD